MTALDADQDRRSLELLDLLAPGAERLLSEAGEA